MTASLVTRVRETWPVLTIAGVYAVMALILNPAYDWPVIDSWAFGWTVDQLLQTGKLHFVDWGAMSLFAHVWWGALFSLPAGFSFGAVNLSTFLLSFVAALASYFALRELSLSRTFSLVGAGAIVVNPAFVVLSYSYMTDVSFLAWFTLGVWSYVRGLRRDDWRWLLLGSAFATLSVLVRQNGVVLPAALAAYLAWQWLRHPPSPPRAGGARQQRNFPWREGLAGVLLPFVSLVTLTVLSQVGIMPDRANALIWLDDGLTLPALGVDLFRILLYMGLFMLPLTLPMGLGLVWQKGRLHLAEAIMPAVLCILAGVGAVIQFVHPFKLPYLGVWRMMPYYPAAWTVYGTGSQEEWLAGVRELVFSYRFWMVITALSCLGAALLLWPVARRGWQALRGHTDEPDGQKWPQGFLLLLIAAYLAPVLLFKGEIYERYLLGLLLPASALVLRALQQQGISLKLSIFAGVGVVFLGFSLALTGEFVAWNGAAWQAAGQLADRGVPVERIDGGFPFNGWQFAGQIGLTDRQPEAGAPAYMEITPQITRDYVVSFSPLEGYEIIDRQPYRSPLHWGERDLVVLERIPGE